MRIGLYGMPTSGKTFILDRIKFISTLKGSVLLRELNPEFDQLDEKDRVKIRKELSSKMKEKDDFIMDGHYAFGDNVVFTEEDGLLYDVFLYLYISPKSLKERINESEKNRKYINLDLDKWQKKEIESLRRYCHDNDKDFYVLDNPPHNCFGEVSSIIEFIKDIVNGYSCRKYALFCANDILEKSTSEIITLMDGDKTITVEDSSKVFFKYETDIYDGNFYTGYQAWKQDKDFTKFVINNQDRISMTFNEKTRNKILKNTFILTSGHRDVWKGISRNLEVDYYCGKEMSADTKFFITKFLQKNGKKVIAYGDSMNDYFMLKQADEGYLVSKLNGSISKSLCGRDLEGLHIV